ncbi:MAG: DUF3784 domain-containing protein [Bacteroidaceae bacterium]|nr:DUF3784 domain-containing protein [Bacteroidaceae bacterium]
MIVCLIIAIPFLILSVIFLMGKGDKLIAGYNTACEEERARVNIKRLRIIMASLCVITAIYGSVLPMLGTSAIKQLGALFVFFLITFVFVTLANTWAKKK